MMNKEAAVYPEQQNPPRATYEALIRGIAICGWLYYAAEQLTIIVTVQGQRTTAEEFGFSNDEERKQARLKAKNLWRTVVLAVLGGV